MKEQTKCAIYARVSTSRGQDVGMQLSELRELCRNRHWKIVSEFVVAIRRKIHSDRQPDLARLKGMQVPARKVLQFYYSPAVLNETMRSGHELTPQKCEG